VSRDLRKHLVRRHASPTVNDGKYSHRNHAPRKPRKIKGVIFWAGFLTIALGLDCAIFEPYPPPYVGASGHNNSRWDISA
jgi:hypothetical protein